MLHHNRRLDVTHRSCLALSTSIFHFLDLTLTLITISSAGRRLCPSQRSKIKIIVVDSFSASAVICNVHLCSYVPIR